MNTEESLYKVISGSGKTVEAATEMLTKAVNYMCENGWIRLGVVVVVGISRNGDHNLIQVVTRSQE